MISDPIADMLTRIRNANAAMHDEVRMPSSKLKEALAGVLKREGYIEDFTVTDEPNRPGRTLTIKMKYSPDRARTISGLRRVSTPGLRVYRKADAVPRVLGPRGVGADQDGARCANGLRVACRLGDPQRLPCPHDRFGEQLPVPRAPSRLAEGVRLDEEVRRRARQRSGGRWCLRGDAGPGGGVRHRPRCARIPSHAQARRALRRRPR